MSARDLLAAHGVELHARAENWTALAADVLAGLRSTPKTLPPKWFYDARGSELFDAITELDEYYLTRREVTVLERHGAAIVEAVRPVELVELGSGSSTKTPLLLDPMADAGLLRRYVPVDVSASAVEAAVPRLVERYPELDVVAEICDFTAPLGLKPSTDGPRLLAFLGSTLGNMQPVEVRAFLERLRPLLGPRDALLIGHDLVKDPAVIEAAYDDARGVTAAFNLNVLAVCNRELGAEFDASLFAHDAHFNRHMERVEMRLRSRVAQVVPVRGLGLEVPFQAGESILTEISRKFRREGIERAYGEAGLALRGWYEDPDGWYAVSLAVPEA
jgi:L-histidine N-alpha-methyltransferase